MRPFTAVHFQAAERLCMRLTAMARAVVATHTKATLPASSEFRQRMRARAFARLPSLTSQCNAAAASESDVVTIQDHAATACRRVHAHAAEDQRAGSAAAARDCAANQTQDATSHRRDKRAKASARGRTQLKQAMTASRMLV